MLKVHDNNEFKTCILPKNVAKHKFFHIIALT
jgi:hypothetical protein